MSKKSVVMRNESSSKILFEVLPHNLCQICGKRIAKYKIWLTPEENSNIRSSRETCQVCFDKFENKVPLHISNEEVHLDLACGRLAENPYQVNKKEKKLPKVDSSKVISSWLNPNKKVETKVEVKKESTKRFSKQISLSEEKANMAAIGRVAWLHSPYSLKSKEEIRAEFDAFLKKFEDKNVKVNRNFIFANGQEFLISSYKKIKFMFFLNGNPVGYMKGGSWFYL